MEQQAPAPQAKTRNTRSSLDVHQIPNFYACYLLKSVRTPKATATYIGSTPHPPRRIRQHNGEISAGAWKTKHNRPWVMQMIIYGFPSKLAALQFEWAWQHPQISRHLRNDDGEALFAKGKKTRSLKANAIVARTMVTHQPYVSWPLHVKLFTQDAVKLWAAMNKDSSIPALPQGFTIQTELEGVDGKSGTAGSGRKGPIDISDTVFTTAHLFKHNELANANRRLFCTVCKLPIADYNTASLNVALCTTVGCTAVSHLSCLGSHFSKQDSALVTIVPRGGHCPKCRSYVLWGDIIRGCYRRHTGAPADPESEPNEDMSTDEPSNSAGEDDLSDNDVPRPASSKGKGKAKAVTNPKKTPKRKPTKHKGVDGLTNISPEGEYFDLNAASSGTDSSDVCHHPTVVPKRAQAPPSLGESRALHLAARPPLPRETADFLAAFSDDGSDHSDSLPSLAKILTPRIRPQPSPYLGNPPSSSRRRARGHYHHDAADHDQQQQKRRRTLSPLRHRGSTPVEIEVSEGEDLGLVPVLSRPVANTIERMRRSRDDDLVPKASEKNILARDESDGDGGDPLTLFDRMSTLSVSSPAHSPPPAHRRVQETGESVGDVIDISD